MATTFVLVSSGLVVASIKRIIPHEVRIATYTTIIALFVTIAKITLDAKFPEISEKLGPYVPLIVVNCIILGRCEAFASKNSPLRSLLDTLGMGLGFTLALAALASVREFLGFGTILQGTPWEVKVFGESIKPMTVMILPAGAFIMFGVLVGLYRAISSGTKQ